MADGWRSGTQQALEDNETSPTEMDQNLPDHVANPDRQIIDVKLVNRLQGRPFMACCRRWQGTTGQMLAEIARALRLGVYELYSLEVTAEYVYGFVKMEGSRGEMRAAHLKNTPTFPEYGMILSSGTVLATSKADTLQRACVQILKTPTQC
ncbi:hypothetical protein M436DRAFT_68270 [Aureobasidium namibiae CBS 147.97]|uniref:Uncharacterized protein n=1 Tax=Aureobasidium namibiae CBS 147.97 TaxID=1043004 RepID=A0A074WEG8_9PEZI